ncbi:DUF2184 domain-containing protein [Sporomusa aerivorans]|uniref:DUF2184 domain-containing protein n=1 Tax=Sporomusa aerivorans TaxID=204936 RepID=UPI00352AEEF9
MKKVYTLDGAAGIPRGFAARPMTMDVAAISGGNAFLVSELEKLDPTLLEPLTSSTYARDIPIESGGGWVETTSVMNVDYAVSGGQADAVGGVQNNVRLIQANLDKDLFKVYPYEVAMQIKFVDMERGKVTGRSLEQIYDDGIRLDWDKYLDINTYKGQAAYGTYGLVNHPGVTVGAVAQNAGGTSTLWKNKTQDEILYDINQEITAAWAAAQYDQSAVANHILIDTPNYAYIASTKVSGQADKTILTFLLDNNIAKEKGSNLFIGDCRWCLGAGSGGTNRMVTYVNAKRFVNMPVPVSLSRVMTQPNVNTASYDSLYVGNVGQVQVRYTQPIRYADGI